MDICNELINICKSKDLEVMLGSSLNLPFHNNCFDARNVCSCYSSYSY